MDLYALLKSSFQRKRNDFQQTAANTRYHISMLAEEIERVSEAGVRILVEEKNQGQILEELRGLEDQAEQWNYQVVCYHTVEDNRTAWDDTTSTSALVIVLPKDLNSWDDSNPSTHQFRLYFLCDNMAHESPSKDSPQHVHLSNHPGYDLERPQEFFQEYGDHVLRMLQMIKRGYSDFNYEIPPLDTFNILWGRDPDVVGTHLTKDNIGPLVDKAITYLQELSPPRQTSRLQFTRAQSAAFKTDLDLPYLDVQECDDAKGNLNRYVIGWKLFWMCQAHVHQRLDHESLKKLKDFVCSHEGYMDMQLAKLKVELGSTDEADQFRVLLFGTKHRFDISLKLNWKASRSYVGQLCMEVAEAKTFVLEIDGVTLDIMPQNRVQFPVDMFGSSILEASTLRCITLLNYPRPQEQCLYIPCISLQSALSPVRHTHNWEELEDGLQKCMLQLTSAQATSDSNTAAEALSATLEKHGLSDVTVVTVYNYPWDAVYDRRKGALVEAYSVDMLYTKEMICLGALQKLTVHIEHLEVDQNFFRMLQTNTGLKELNISCRGNGWLYHAEHIVRFWHEASCSFCLTLIDRALDGEGRVSAQMSIHGRGSNLIDPYASDDLSSCQNRAVNESGTIEFLQWDCDDINGQLSDYSASLLDMATQQHPSVLALFVLDVSLLSHSGLFSIQNVLRRSCLEHFHIICTPVDQRLSKVIAQILGSVQWPILKSLELSGDHIDEWIQLWSTPNTNPLDTSSFTGIETQLLRLHIQGSKPQLLSHSSMLFIHAIVHSSPLAELRLGNIQLQDPRDWRVVIDAVDYSLLDTLSLFKHRSYNPASMTELWDVLSEGLL